MMSLIFFFYVSLKGTISRPCLRLNSRGEKDHLSKARGLIQLVISLSTPALRLLYVAVHLKRALQRLCWGGLTSIILSTQQERASTSTIAWAAQMLRLAWEVGGPQLSCQRVILYAAWNVTAEMRPRISSYSMAEWTWGQYRPPNNTAMRIK